MVQMSKPPNKRKYAAASVPMLVLMLGGSAMLLGERAILSGLAPAPERIPTKKKSPKDYGEEYMSRRKRWWKYTKDMPICKHVEAVCNDDGLLPRLRDSVASGAKMRSSVMGIGGGPTSLIGLVCAAVGILLYGREKNASKMGDKETPSSTVTDKGHYHAIKPKDSDVEENVFKNNDEVKDKKSSLYLSEEGSADSLHDSLEQSSVNSTCTKLKDNTMTYLSGTNFTWENPVVLYKIFVALLLFIELNDLMAPEQTIMYTPELIQLQRAKPDPREYVPYMADYLTPSLNADTADLWVKRLRMVRGLLLFSWLTYLILPPKKIGGVCYAVGALLYCYLATIGLMYNLGHSMQVSNSLPQYIILSCSDMAHI